MFRNSHVRRAAPVAPLALAILVGTLVAAAAATSPGSRAAGTAAKHPATQTAQNTAPATTAGITVTDTAPAPCATARRKLWIEGDGWVIRRVPVCAGGGL
jgi:hypothetical protein